MSRDFLRLGVGGVALFPREFIIKTELVPYSVDFALYGLVNRNALGLTLFPDFVFLLARDINSLLAGSLSRSSYGADDVARLLAADVLAEEVVGVNRDKEVAEMIRSDIK